jgi:hypothetical protein
MQISSRSRLLLISDQASFLSSRAPGASIDPLLFLPHTHGEFSWASRHRSSDSLLARLTFLCMAPRCRLLSPQLGITHD